MSTSSQRAVDDLVTGSRSVRLWTFLAWDDLKSRYRRTLLGPFWFTLTHAATLIGLSILWSTLFKRALDEYFVFLTAGWTVWALVAMSMSEAPGAFLRAKTLLSAYDLPASAQIYRLVLHMFMIFAHNMLVYVVAVIFVRNPMTWATLLAVPALVLLFLCAIGWTTILGFLGTRYRDVAPAMVAITGIMFLLTPIFWAKQDIGANTWVVEINPFYHLIEIVRAPLLGQAPTVQTWAFVAGTAVVSNLVAAWVFVGQRRNLSYWM